MTWKTFQRVIWGLLAVCAGGIVLFCVISGMGFVLVIDQVDSWDIMWVLFVTGLLALMVWGDAALVKFLKGWERVVALVFVLAVEGLALFVLGFFSLYFSTSPRYYPVYGPAGETVLVACEESWFFSVWGEFYRPAVPGLLRDTGVTYAAHDIWPFAHGYYELEYQEDQIVIHYEDGVGDWETCIVPLDR